MSFAEELNALLALLRREIGRFLRIWQQTLLPPIITATLYFLIFGKVVGARIGEMGGVDYIAFIVPGLLMMSVITSAYNNVSFSLFSMKFQRSIEELMVSPISNWLLMFGFVSGGIARGLIVAALVSSVAYFFVDIEIYSVWGFIGALLLSSLFFSFIGFINALLAETFDHVNVVPSFILAPLIYLGGVFYSVRLLPEPWQSLSMINPIFYLVNMARYALLGVSDVPVYGSLLAIMAFTLLAGGTSYLMLVKGVGLKE